MSADYEIRALIDAKRIVMKLQHHALSPIECMSKSQVSAAKILLDKRLSDAPTILAGDKENPLTVTRIERVIIKPGKRDKK